MRFLAYSLSIAFPRNVSTSNICPLEPLLLCGIAKESTPLSLKASIQVQRSSGLRESILVHGLIGALEELKMTFLCKFPPST